MTTDKTIKIPAPLWTSLEAVEATGGSTGELWEVGGVSIDSRTVKKGDLFVALKGPNNDGHDYVSTALKTGAAAAMVSEEYRTDLDLNNLLRVEDTQKGLEALGRAARKRSPAKIIGVTGSVGKTGTKEMLGIALDASGKTHASRRSYNNHWGVPLTLANMPLDAQYGVFEMGMNHVGELTELSRQVQPHIAVITTIEPVHLGHFESVEQIADAKAEIFNGMPKDGVAVLNCDNGHFKRLSEAAAAAGVETVLCFGEDENADARLVDCRLQSDGSKVTAEIMGERVRYRLSIPGRHIVLNSLAALLAVKAAGADLHAAVDAIANAEPIEGRGAREEIVIDPGKPPVLVIDESYNASPAAMEAAFTVLSMAEPAEGGRRIAALGDMLELGAEGPALHQGLANSLLKARTELVFTCGPLMEALHQALPDDWRGGHAGDSKALAEQVCAAVRPGDVVLVKGSLGSRMAYVVQALQELHVQGGEQAADNEEPQGEDDTDGTAEGDRRNAL